MGLRIGGEKPSSLLIEKATPHREEMYLSITLDRGIRSFVIIGARVGGVDVEAMQGKIIEPVPVEGLREPMAKSFAFRMNLWGQDEAQFVRILHGPRAALEGGGVRAGRDQPPGDRR